MALEGRADVLALTQAERVVPGSGGRRPAHRANDADAVTGGETAT
jgi:hypothetical protein